MSKFVGIKKRAKGFTLVELIVVIAVIAIMTAIAIPGIINWLPDYRLKRAARDLYGNMQFAKATAARNNVNCAIVFDTTVNPGRYFVCLDSSNAPPNNPPDGIWNGPPQIGGDDTMLKEVPLDAYGSNIDYGFANANRDMQGNVGAPVGNITYITYNGAPPPPLPRVTVFNPRGMSDVQQQGGITEGYVYLQNNSNDPAAERTTYGVGGPASGAIRIRKWYPQPGDWQ